MTGPVTCERCGTVAKVDWHDVRTHGESGPRYIMGFSECPTPGCVNDDGNKSVMPPDQPGQLLRDNHKWLRHHRRLIEALGRANRQLMEAT